VLRCFGSTTHVTARIEEVRVRFQCVFVAIAATLIAAPGLGGAPQRSDRNVALRQIAAAVARVIGTASVCREISWPRMKALTDNLSDLIKATVANSEELSSIQQAYDQSTVEGQFNVNSKRTDCAAALHELADLERALSSQSAAAAGDHASPSQPRIGATTGVALPQRPRQSRDR
jgi:hypothetical protein